MVFFAGIEGGASFSKVVLLDETGKVVSSLEEEPSSNIWLIGKNEWADRINAMIGKAFTVAGLPATKVQCLGLCLSGCEDAAENEKLGQFLSSKYPSLCVNCKVASDTVGSIMTASPEGGIVLIAGTGSNSLLLKADGTSTRVGGWGHLIGDYGSAYWISQLMIRYLIEDEENFNPLPMDTTEARKAVFEHFNISSTIELLKPLYEEFDKTHFAQLCARLAQLASEKKDSLSLRVFEDAGRVLGQHILALLPKTKEEELSVICVGSVFKSWKLLEKTFIEKLGIISKRINIRYLTQSSAIGAAYFAAKSHGVKLPIDFSKNYHELCCYQNGKILQ